MEERIIKTNLGRIAVTVDNRGTKATIIFMHGMFLDKSLWLDVAKRLPKVTRIYIDMPAHGGSSNVGHDWTLNDCVDLLMQIMDELKLDRCFLIGHSWGGMVALRAAVKYPERFKALGLFNMPFTKVVGLRRLGFILQKAVLFFPGFYAKQAAKSLYSEEILRTRPELSIQMQERIAARPPRELARVIDAVILNAEDATHMINELRVPALVVVGRNDYVGKPPRLDSWTVAGGHISPQESVEKITDAVVTVLGMRGR